MEDESLPSFTASVFPNGELKYTYPGAPFFVRSSTMIPRRTRLPRNCFYFELTVKKECHQLIAGICTAECTGGVLGWTRYGIGYRGRNGNLLHNSHKGIPYGTALSDGDVLGCMVDHQQQFVFFVVKGIPLRAYPLLPSQRYYPAITLTKNVGELGVNFGTKPFVYEPISLLGSFSNFDLTASLSTLLDNPVFLPDVCFTFTDSTHTILAHSFILSARSMHFAMMFESTRLHAKKISKIKVGGDVAAFRSMLDFIYTGQVEIKGKEAAHRLCALASAYSIDTLVRVINESFGSGFFSASESHWVGDPDQIGLFSDLPEEILYKIFNTYLSTKKKSLSALAQSCKYLYRVINVVRDPNHYTGKIPVYELPSNCYILGEPDKLNLKVTHTAWQYYRRTSPVILEIKEDPSKMSRDMLSMLQQSGFDFEFVVKGEPTILARAHRPILMAISPTYFKSYFLAKKKPQPSLPAVVAPPPPPTATTVVGPPLLVIPGTTPSATPATAATTTVTTTAAATATATASASATTATSTSTATTETSSTTSSIPAATPPGETPHVPHFDAESDMSDFCVSNGISEDTVNTLTQLGFPVWRVIEALLINDGDINMAVDWLLSTREPGFERLGIKPNIKETSEGPEGETSSGAGDRDGDETGWVRIISPSGKGKWVPKTGTATKVVSAPNPVNIKYTIPVGMQHYTPETPETSESFVCTACKSVLTSNEVLSAVCGHAVCIDCWHKMIERQESAAWVLGKSAFKQGGSVCCPVADCTSGLPALTVYEKIGKLFNKNSIDLSQEEGTIQHDERVAAMVQKHNQAKYLFAKQIRSHAPRTLELEEDEYYNKFVLGSFLRFIYSGRNFEKIFYTLSTQESYGHMSTSTQVFALHGFSLLFQDFNLAGICLQFLDQSGRLSIQLAGLLWELATNGHSYSPSAQPLVKKCEDYIFKHVSELHQKTEMISHWHPALIDVIIRTTSTSKDFSLSSRLFLSSVLKCTDNLTACIKEANELIASADSPSCAALTKEEVINIMITSHRIHNQELRDKCITWVVRHAGDLKLGTKGLSNSLTGDIQQRLISLATSDRTVSADTITQTKMCSDCNTKFSFTRHKYECDLCHKNICKHCLTQCQPPWIVPVARKKVCRRCLELVQLAQGTPRKS
ncbi:Ran-binding protein 9/10 [Pelomyxa schiedti]|nr:Ran-binding protein 9/10 [Pelomyxa schiedti]